MCEIIIGGTDLKNKLDRFPYSLFMTIKLYLKKIHITAPKRSNNAFHCYDKYH